MKDNILYLDGTTGISGDMIVAALIDLGADRAALESALNSIPADGFETKISRVVKNGIDACDFDVILDDEHENYDHDMAYLFGDSIPAESGQTHSHEHHHSHHEHRHGHDHEHHHDHYHGAGHHHEESHSHAHGHEHRHLAEIMEIINQCDMTDGAKEIAHRTFRILAEAEAEAHDATPETVGFHEAGAIDSIVDIIAAAVFLDSLAPAKVCVPVLYEGRGTVRCQHGVLPVPVPAVVNIVRKHGLPLHIADYRGEYVTPTGAAFAAAVATDFSLPERFRILRTGTGAGKRAYTVPGMLRAMLIETVSGDEEEKIFRLETNIDDSTGEEFAYVMDRLLDAGARDVHYHPIYMKKNRPAYQLNVICMASDVSRLEEIIFRETSTIGIRRIAMERTVLRREIHTVETSLGPADVKVVDLGEGRRAYPEYRTAAAIASEKGLPLREVMRRIESEAAELFR